MGYTGNAWPMSQPPISRAPRDFQAFDGCTGSGRCAPLRQNNFTSSASSSCLADLSSQTVHRMCNCELQTNKSSKSWVKKVMKRIQGKIGKENISGGMSPNNMPPLLFHNVHGDNVIVSRQGSMAKRINGFSKAIVFSNRPIKVEEKVYVKLSEVSSGWRGALRMGFSAHDPASLRSGLPNYVIPDLTSQPGFWAQEFKEDKGKQGKLIRKDAIIFYYIDAAGDVHFGIDGKEKGIFSTGVDTRRRLWAMLDIYGFTSAIEFFDPRCHLRKQMETSSNQVLQCSSRRESYHYMSESNLLQNYQSVSNVSRSRDRPECSALSLRNETEVASSSSRRPQSVVTEIPVPQTSPWSPECIVCCENPVDSVFYPCGHCCMCFTCAVEYRKNNENVCCVICRAPVTDIIRTYKS